MSKTLCFTGHRPQRLGGFDESNPKAQWVKEKLKVAIERAWDHGYSHFIAGGALGVDTWAAELVLDLRDECGGGEYVGREVTLAIAVPCRGHGSKWPQHSRDRYEDILSHADEVHLVTDAPFSPERMHRRNQWMVDHSDVVIAVYSGAQSGGTYECVKYAKSRNRKILVIDPTERRVYWIK